MSSALDTSKAERKVWIVRVSRVLILLCYHRWKHEADIGLTSGHRDIGAAVCSTAVACSNSRVGNSTSR